MYGEDTVNSLEIGKGSVLRSGSNVAIIANGVMVHKAMKAAEELSTRGIDATVVDMHTLKPLDTELLDRLATECSGIVTVEDHSVIAGLGSAVAEHLSQTNPTKIKMLGVQDRFGESGGSEELLEMVGLTSEAIIAASESLV
jgi:transketolase